MSHIWLHPPECTVLLKMKMQMETEMKMKMQMIQDCGAVALDSTGADISSSIVVVDVTPCATGAVCPACAITFAAAGLCQPGAYLYLYRSAKLCCLAGYPGVISVRLPYGHLTCLCHCFYLSVCMSVCLFVCLTKLHSASQKPRAWLESLG